MCLSAECKIGEGFWHEMVPNDGMCGWLHLWHRYGHCTNLMWFCLMRSVNDCIVDYNWFNISLQWYRMVVCVGGCICGIDMAIAPICCDCAWWGVWMIALLITTGLISACNGTEWWYVWVVAFVASLWPLHQSVVILLDEECEWLHCWLQLV